MRKNTIKHKLLLNLILCSTLTMVSCGGGFNSNTQGSLVEGITGNMEGYVNSDVNAIQQAQPTLMVIPSDNLLKQNGCLKELTENGKSFILRDYKKFMSANNDNKAIVSTIQNTFIKVNYPLQDLEQTLKQLDTQGATDLADGLEKDAKTFLLTTAQPDIVLELDYSNKMSMTGKLESSVSYTLSAMDSYTNKVVATENGNGLKGASTAEIINNDLSTKMASFQGDIQKSFNDILTRGREVTVRIAVANGTNVHMNDTNIEGDTYTDWIIDYIKTHSVKGAFKLNRNTDSELFFTGVRIGLLNQDGTQYGVYDWARDFNKAIRKNLGVKCTNKAQGLGEILIVINGL